MSNFVELLETDGHIDTNEDNILEQIKGMLVFKHIDITKNKKKDDIRLLANNLNNYIQKINCEYIILGTHKIKMSSEQREIINSPINRNTRIIACAGSGKTTTILARVKYLIDNHTLPNKILILTFNVEACANLKKKLCEMVGFNLKVEIRTIDSLCAKLFYKYGKDVCNRNYRIVSINDYPKIALKVLKKYGSIICSKYEHVFFDEFQDVNETQFNILNQFYINGSYLTVIGDDNQNIYQWRGTDNTYIINFDNIIKNTQTFTLSTNYRSNAQIIQLANESIRNNVNQIKKTMISVNTGRNIPELRFFMRKELEYTNIIETMIKYGQGTGSYGNVALLSRNNSNLKEIEEILTKFNIENPQQIIPFVTLIDDNSDEKPHIDKNSITLSTIHKTKGLEWDTVIVIGICDFLFPNIYDDTDEGIEEERRLFYVAVTRAKHNLYFYVNKKDVPVSRFIREVMNYVKYVNMSNNKTYDNIRSLFPIKENRGCIKKEYNVKEIMKLLQQKDFENIRNMGFLDEIENNIVKIAEYVDHISLCEQIRSNFLENDAEIFFNKIVARDILTKLVHQNISDKSCEEMLNSVNLSEEEAEILCKCQMRSKFDGQKISLDKLGEICGEFEHLSDYEKTVVVNISEKAKLCTGDSKIIKEYSIPNNFIKNVFGSYEKYKDINEPTKNIIHDIYNVSLVDKIMKNRKRLVYRSVFDVFYEEYGRIADNINKFLIQKFNNFMFCEVSVNKLIKITEKLNISLYGEVFLADIDNGELICIKYSEAEIKIEWILEQLILYTLMAEKEEIIDAIDKICIINMLRGKSYTFQLPDKQYIDKLADYIMMVIKRNTGTMANREVNIEEDVVPTVKNIISKFDMEEEKTDKKIARMYLDFSHDRKNAAYIMVVDTETTGVDLDSDIIQLSYILYDNSGKPIKKYNKYVKPDFSVVTNENYNVHKISNDFLDKNGLPFTDIIHEFLQDLRLTYCIVGHNVAFDMRMIKYCIDKYYIVKKDIFCGIEIVCTCMMYKKVSSSSKAIKLADLYQNLFSSKMVNAHNALYDVIYCGKCYFKMLEILNKKILSLDDIIIENTKKKHGLEKRIKKSKKIFDTLFI